MSLAFNQQGDKLCVLNGGKVNGVKSAFFQISFEKNAYGEVDSSCYNVDKTKGLTPIPNSLRPLGINQTTPATGPEGSASHVIFSENGQNLIASVKGQSAAEPGFLAVWNVQQDGSLSETPQKMAPAQNGALPFSMTVIPGKNAILATDAGLGFDIFDMSNNGSASGNRSSANPIAGQKATCWSSFSSKTGNFYLTDIGTSMVTEVNVNNNLNGTIVKVRLSFIRGASR
jgi:hypothetical protein